jgi:predicted nuclease of predicted toxin-antitoxin system
VLSPQFPDGYPTTDTAISIAAAEGRVVSKDSDFQHSHLAGGAPVHLLVRVGNTTNDVLIALLDARC